jgi:hypothetical protein
VELPSYKYVPVTDGQSAESFGAMSKRLEKQKSDGWEFCGSVELRLTKGEYEALRADKVAPEDDGMADRLSYRVLVFKRAASVPTQAKADAINSFNPAANPASDPRPMPAAKPFTNRLGLKYAKAEEVATTLQKMFGSANVKCAYDAASNSLLFSGDERDVNIIKVAAAEIDRLSAAVSQPKTGDGRTVPADRNGKMATAEKEPSTVPQTVVYSVSDVAFETMEKVATTLANSAGNPPVTIVADTKSSALILAGDARALEVIIDRLESTRMKLRSLKPGSAK